jgi:N-acetyl-anhydromuramyl-L-alanine amidase AmpD
MDLDVTKIKQIPLKSTEYFKEEIKKTQIVLHHTAGNSSGVNVVNDWNSDKRGRIATCVTISGPGARNSYDGEIVQCFSSKYWAYHLGIKGDVFKAHKVPHQILDKLSIGIEICNWGQLEKINGKYFNYVDREVPADQVTELISPYKNYKYFHKYSDAQIESTRQLLKYWGKIYNIDLSFDYTTMFSVTPKALRGGNGIYSHNSYRRDKIDIYPCPRMIDMLVNLNK